jgi:hypothetical protein
MTGSRGYMGNPLRKYINYENPITNDTHITDNNSENNKYTPDNNSENNKYVQILINQYYIAERKTTQDFRNYVTKYINDRKGLFEYSPFFK